MWKEKTFYLIYLSVWCKVMWKFQLLKQNHFTVLFITCSLFSFFVHMCFLILQVCVRGCANVFLTGTKGLITLIRLITFHGGISDCITLWMHQLVNVHAAVNCARALWWTAVCYQSFKESLVAAVLMDQLGVNPSLMHEQQRPDAQSTRERHNKHKHTSTAAGKNNLTLVRK